MQALALNFAEASEVARELRAGLLGAVVQNVFVPWEGRLYLELRLPGQSVLLCLSGELAGGRVSVATQRPTSPLRASSFQQLLRARLVGTRLAGIDDDLHALHWRRGSAAPADTFALRVSWREGAQFISLWKDDAFLAASPATAAKVARVPSPSFTPNVDRPNGMTHPFERPSIASEARFAPLKKVAFPWAEAAEQFLEQAGHAHREAQLQRAHKQAFKTRRDRLTRTMAKVAQEAARATEAQNHQRIAQLLTHHLHQLRRGQKTVMLTDYTEEGPVLVEVRLDPRRSPSEEVAWRFHQAKRLQRGAQLAAARLLSLQAELESLKREESHAPSSIDKEKGGTILVPVKRPARATGFRVFQAAQEARILVGKNARGNDELTFRVARGHDFWVHVRGKAGSHVLIRMEKGATLQQEVLLDAAHLAVHYSEAKGENAVEIQYALARHVKRMPKGLPGQVLVTQEKVFLVRLDPERMRRLLTSIVAES